MLSDFRCHPTIPVTNLDTAKKFYGSVLGFEPQIENQGGVMYSAGGNTRFFVYRAAAPSSGAHTTLGFDVKGIDGVVQDLRSRGVVFEEYDYPALKTVDGIADTPPGRAAWFKDPEGNIIGMIELGD